MISETKRLKAELFDAGEQLDRVTAERDQLKAEVETDDRLLAERDRLVAAIPQCPVHGPCIPYAIEWVERAILMMKNLKAENEALRKDAERYRWMRASTDHYAEMYFGFADESETDRAIDDAMAEDFAQKAGLI